MLRERCNVVVFSGRSAVPVGVEAMTKWLAHHDIAVDAVCDVKPLADVYVDDRAVPFRGNWEETLASIASFQQWQEPIKAALRMQRNRRQYRPTHTR